MKEFLKSVSSYSLAMSLFPLEMARSAMTSDGNGRGRKSAAEVLDSITGATVRQFGGTAIAAFSALDHAQRGLIAAAWNTFFPSVLDSNNGSSDHQ